MSVDLGFIDKSCKLLESRFFPSKVGGKPAWLDLKSIPDSSDIVCKECNECRTFLCQLYCPINEKDTAFHRIVYIFMCLSKTCFQPNLSKNFIVFRNQLPKQNLFYPDTPPEESLSWRPDITCEKYGVKLCVACGIKAVDEFSIGDKFFCSKSHQKLFAEHDGKGTKSKKGFNILLPEFSLSIEPEYPYSDEESESDEDSEPAIDDKIDIQKLGSMQNDPTVEQFFKDCEESTHDKYFFNFKSRISENPDQVVRYGRGTKPLWLSEKYTADNEIPKCEYCGEERDFEFQVLPQLLNYVNIDKDRTSTAGVFDWGTLVVYTCKSSCDSDPAYKVEYLWKQDLTE